MSEATNDAMVNETAIDAKVEEKAISTNVSAPMGFEDEVEGDMIIPRIKVINALSPECKDRLAAEGDILNSLTKTKLNEKVFVPVFKFNSNIFWKPRNEGGGILCQARDGKSATQTDGKNLQCHICRKNEFDNTKTGRESFPTCTKYINFFGFIVGEPIPIILSFSKTNYNEGKKMYSLAKVTMQNMWNHGYTLSSKKLAKNGNEWYNMVISAAGQTAPDEQKFGMNLYKQFRNAAINVDMDTEVNDTESYASQEEVKSTEF
jgi:hypothetical protein